MHLLRNSKGFLLRGAEYHARIETSAIPVVTLLFDGRELARLPLVSTLDTVQTKEKLTNARITGVEEGPTAVRVELTADSNVWTSHRFFWTFEKARASYYHEVTGTGDLTRCCFFSSGKPLDYSPGDSDGYASNASFLVPRYHTFNPNLANVTEFDISQPAYAGVGRSEHPYLQNYMLLNQSGLFSPGPLCLAFHEEESTMAVGVGTRPGGYRFGGLEYTGFTASAAALYVQYLGYTRAEGSFRSPEALLTFGYGPFACLQDYIAWIDERGYGTAFQFPEAPWHRRPIFCGWSEQCAVRPADVEATDMATQANYEAWTDQLDAMGIPFGTLIIDAKWQKYYGRFDEIDTDKWPDLPGFIRRQHEKGRHVLLWIPCYQQEGVPEEFMAYTEDGRALFPAPGNAAYDQYVHDSIVSLLRQTDADGFKEDWISGAAGEPNAKNYGSLHGIELMRRFQATVYDALHEVKPDGVLETQTPNPLFRESSDVLRLNDCWFGVRDVTGMMRERARIARIVGWDRFDCDDASAITLAQWLRYLQAQPKIGIPSQLCVTTTSTSQEKITSDQMAYLASLWRDYLDDNGLKEPQ